LRPDAAVTGPFTIQPDDVPAVNQLFADAFTERYHRDGLAGVQVPPLNPAIWTYAIRLASEGAMLWRDADGAAAAFNVAHRAGAEGWMGPLAVRPDLQGVGVGRTIVHAAMSFLREREVTTLGLETMPRTVENIGFYSRLGFEPGYLTVTLGRDVPSGTMPSDVQLLSDIPASESDAVRDACRTCMQRAAPGYDFTREIALTAELGLGETAIFLNGDDVEGFAVWHTAPLANRRRSEEVRLLKLFAGSPDVFGALIHALETTASRLKVGRVAVRCQSRFTRSFRTLIDLGYQVRWTDLRMTLAGYAEPELDDGVVLLSNWEI
jgi:GNAT superfamily N-acetyltransferase